MTDWTEDKDGVWLIYDRQCPMCSMAAEATRIKEAYGTLKLIDARDLPENDPLMQAINERDFDLDEGMVMFHDGTFYFGDRALHFMANVGKKKGILNRINSFLFSRSFMARLLYPVLRSIRILLLRLKGVGKMNNLDNSKTAPD